MKMDKNLVGGSFRFVFSEGGNVTKKTDWMHNLITDHGLNAMASGDWMHYLHLSSDSGVPHIGTTNMQGIIQSAYSGSGTSDSAYTQAPYYLEYIRKFTFPPTGADANIAKVYLSNGDASESACTEALILDGNGSAVAMTKRGEETLDVYYAIRLYIPLEVKTYIIPFSIKGVMKDFEVTMTPAAIGGNGWSGYGIVYGGEIQNNSVLHKSALVYPLPTDTLGGGWDSGWNGTVNRGNEGYVQGSFEREIWINFPKGVGNYVDGLGSVVIRTNFSRHVATFKDLETGKGLPKTDVDGLTLNFVLKWGRYEP